MKLFILNNGQRLVANELHLTVQINNRLTVICKDKKEFDTYIASKSRAGVKHTLAI